MATKNRVTTKPPSVAEQARAIYNRHVQMVEDGRHDSSMSFRQAVLEEYRSTFDTSEGALASYYASSKRAAQVTVNDQFEIERKGTPPSPPAQKSKTLAPSPSKVLKKVPGNNIELTLVPKQGPGTTGAAPVSKALPTKVATPPNSRVSTPAAKVVTSPSPSLSAPAAKPTAKQRAEKVHADLIALCKEEIAEAFGTLEELLDNVDQLGDAKTLKTFTRQVRSACKKIESQIATKAILDKQQAQKILPRL
ncbi:MAG: hypothetical protein Q8S02_10050 [Hydrogenophaga sp.]|nr:hypothetical protein [Hydrogenophaga sp.]